MKLWGFILLAVVGTLGLVGWALYLRARFGGIDADERNCDRDEMGIV